MTVKTKKVAKKKATAKRKKKIAKKFKYRGGSAFSLSINNNRLHDILREELNLFGITKMSGTASPFDAVDTYRAALFFMWGIPLDTPIDKEFKKKAQKAIRRLKKEEPELYEKWKAKHDLKMAKP